LRQRLQDGWTAGRELAAAAAAAAWRVEPSTSDLDRLID
jgi:hypothetical protein